MENSSHKRSDSKGARHLKEGRAAASAIGLSVRRSCGTLLVELHCGQATVGILYPFVDEAGLAAE